MDHYDNEAARELGLDPDDPDVIEAFDLVRWDPALLLAWTNPTP